MSITERCKIEVVSVWTRSAGLYGKGVDYVLADTNFFANFYNQYIYGTKLYDTFIYDDRYKFFLTGLQNTLVMSLLACLIGVAIGLVLTYFKLSRFKVLQGIAYFYTDIIRATPVVTQCLIIYFVIFPATPFHLNKIIIGAIAFGINSGAYVSEIVRAGILSIDQGQTEAGRSLGLNAAQTMVFIIMPQAVKNILPALANEFIVLIKETAIAGIMTITDLTKAAQGVQAQTYDFAYPLIGSAIMYYIIIKILTNCLRRFENRLRRSEKR